MSAKLRAMDISPLLRDHVYMAILLGGIVEGETTLVPARLAARDSPHARATRPLGYLMLFAAVVDLLSDRCLFGLGRWQGPTMQRG